MSDAGVILMAVYRPDPRLLARQIESLKVQTLRDWRCLVAIDGSDPDTVRLLRRLVGDDTRFQVTEHPVNVGHYRNFERLTQQVPAWASWVAYCDQDDYWYPEKLERLASLLREGPRNTAAVAAARLVDGSGETLGVARRRAAPFGHLLLKNEVTGCLAMFRPDVVRTALPFPPPTRSAVHDFWVAVCAGALGEVVFSDEPLQDYVQHGANTLGEPPTPTVRSHIRSLRRDGGPLAHLETVTRERWGWRVSISRTLLERQPSLSEPQARVVRAIAKGSLSPQLLRHLFSDVAAGRLMVRDGVSMSASAMWWRRATGEGRLRRPR